MIFDVVARSGGFNPLNISGVVLWLDAADPATITLDGSNNVSEWRDKSGFGRHANQSLAGSRPGQTTLSGLNAIRFDGVNDHLLVPTQILRGNTTHGLYWVFARLGSGSGDVYRPSVGGMLPTTAGADIGSFHYVKNSNNLGASYPFVLTGNTQGNYIYYDNAGPAYVSNRPYVMAFQNNVTGFGVWRDGTLEGTTNGLRTPSNINNGIILGAQLNPARYSNIALAEVILVEQSDTTTRQLIEAYLKAKWSTP